MTVRRALGEANVRIDDILIASFGMRPDRILLGELRGTAAFTFLRAVSTGHPGSLTSIRASWRARAIEQIALLFLQSRVQMRREDIVSYLNNIVDVIVQLERRGCRRIPRLGAATVIRIDR